MTKLYYNLSPPSRSVRMLIKHLGKEADFDLIYVDSYGKGETRSAEFVKINPQHCVPTLIDDDLTLWESRAILKYLATKYESDLLPKDPKQAATVDRLLFFDGGTFIKAIGETYLCQWLFQQPAEESSKKKLRDTVALLDGFLANSPYAAGNQLTIVDFSIVCNVSLLLGFSQIVGDNEYPDLKDYPNIAKWFDKMKSELPFQVIEEDDAKVKEIMANPETFNRLIEIKKGGQ